MRGAGGGVALVENNHSRIHAWFYSGAQFNVTTQGLMLGTSPDLGPKREYGVELHGY